MVQEPLELLAPHPAFGGDLLHRYNDEGTLRLLSYKPACFNFCNTSVVRLSKRSRVFLPVTRMSTKYTTVPGIPCRSDSIVLWKIPEAELSHSKGKPVVAKEALLCANRPPVADKLCSYVEICPCQFRNRSTIVGMG